MDAPTISPEMLSTLWSPWAMVLTALVLCFAWLIARTLRFVVNSLANRFPDYRFALLRFFPLASIFVWSGAVFVIVTVVFDPTGGTVAALVGASVFAIGFAAQDFFKNIIGGVVILFDRPFQVGDKVEIAPYYGEIVSIGLRSTKLVTLDNCLVTVPNARLLDQSVCNNTAGALDFQIVTDLYLPNTCDVGLAERVAWQAAATSPYTFLDKPIEINIADASHLHVWTLVRIRSSVLDIRLETLYRSDIAKRAKRAFIEHGLLVETAPPALDTTAPSEAEARS